MNAGAGRDTDSTDELIDVRADLGDQRHRYGSGRARTVLTVRER